MIKGFILVLSISILSGCISVGVFGDRGLTEQLIEGNPDNGKALLIHLNGTITTVAEDSLLQPQKSSVVKVTEQLEIAKRDDEIKAIILAVDSPGGTITGSDILYHEINSFRDQTGKPVIFVMMNVAASGGYYIAMASDYILAHPTSITGSVGVIAVTMNAKELLDKIGLQFTAFTTGENKDAGAPFRALTSEEERQIEFRLSQMGERFYQIIADSRGEKINDWQIIKTGQIFLAQEALQLGMIDGIGYLGDAFSKARELSGFQNLAIVSWQRNNNQGVVSRYNQQSDQNLELPYLKQSVLSPGLYYLWTQL